jgi:hypothetical protein
VHFASFDLEDPVYEACGLRLSAQLVTLENLYGIDPARTRVEGGAERAAIRAEGLRWAGGSEPAEGLLELRVVREGPARWRLSARGEAPAPLRCLKLLLRDLDPLADVPTHGELLTYPGRLPAPIARFRCGSRTVGVRAEDPLVRGKRFAAYAERVGALAGRGVLELIHEAAAPDFSPALEAPPFAVAMDDAAGALEREHEAFLAEAHGLRPWEERSDVPDWARDLRLVVTLHGMHWTGRVFLTYADMERALRAVCERVDGRHVLAYLPGWEGRYYWQYGDYRPEPRLGGESGFAALCDAARSLGVHLMPMFGANCANLRLPAFRDLDASVFLKSATGNRFHGNQPDWDLSRACDTGWQAWLNPGHPTWRAMLAEQIESLAGRFGFDAVFLDTTEIWTNDPDYPVFDGLRALAARLHEAIPGLLLAGEYDYDALLSVFPLFQRAWWAKAPAWTARYVRRFGHLCEGEAEGRTGVHEFGVWRPGPVAPAPGLLATAAFQGGSADEWRAAVAKLLPLDEPGSL